MPGTRKRNPFANDPLASGTVPTAVKDRNHQLTLQAHASPTPETSDPDRAAEMRLLRRHFATFLRRLRDRSAPSSRPEFQASDFRVYLDNRNFVPVAIDLRVTGSVVLEACKLGVIERTGQFRPNGGAPGSNYSSTTRPVYVLANLNNIPEEWS